MGWLADNGFFWYWDKKKKILYSELYQLNNVHLGLGGETFMSFIGLRHFLEGPQVILWKENTLERESDVLLLLSPFPEPFPLWHPDGGTHGTCPYTLCLFSMQFSLHVFWGRLLFVAALIHKFCHIPWHMDLCWTARESLGFPEVCSC